jgi:hypothetical protein
MDFKKTYNGNMNTFFERGSLFIRLFLPEVYLFKKVILYDNGHTKIVTNHLRIVCLGFILLAPKAIFFRKSLAKS